MLALDRGVTLGKSACEVKTKTQNVLLFQSPAYTSAALNSLYDKNLGTNIPTKVRGSSLAVQEGGQLV